MADKKDEIISMQLDLIRQMTENNIRRLSDDIWGPRRDADKKKADGTPKTPVQPRIPGTPPVNPVSGGASDANKPDEDLTKASDGGDGGQRDSRRCHGRSLQCLR